MFIDARDLIFWIVDEACLQKELEISYLVFTLWRFNCFKNQRRFEFSTIKPLCSVLFFLF